MPAWSPKPRVEKIPLPTRKEIRDAFESKKEGYESTIAGLVGVPFKIDIDVNAICAYANPGSTVVGAQLSGYVDGFTSGLQHLIKNYGDIGLQYFKDAVTSSTLTIAVNEQGDKASIVDADVKDGVFRILFKHDTFGYNANQLTRPVVIAIENAPHNGFSLLTQYSTKAQYTEKIRDVHDEIAKILNLPDVVLDPNFEENFAALEKKKNNDNWKANFGEFTLKYFTDGVQSRLLRQGFKDDDMMQEGFAEGVPSKTIKLRIVDKTKKGSLNEAVLEDGILYIQTTAQYWGYNVDQVGINLTDLL